jgi:putative ABC transport system permease protein
VAGVVIMNVMLVAVAERRSEIGLLKALGASTRQILGVFLAEAAVLSTAGGLAGLALGFVAVRGFVRFYPNFPASPPQWALVASLLVSLLVGVLFGVLLARRVTCFDLVVALSGR